MEILLPEFLWDGVLYCYRGFPDAIQNKDKTMYRLCNNHGPGPEWLLSLPDLLI